MIVFALIVYLACLFGIGFFGGLGIVRTSRGEPSGTLFIGMAVALGCIAFGARRLVL